MIIFINGPINSGKSTVAKLLAERLPKTALIEVDRFHEFIEWMPIGEAVPLNLKNATSVIKNFSEVGLNVVVPYPLSKKNYDWLMRELESLHEKIFVFTLSPPLEVALTDRGERKLTEQERERIKYHYEIGINNPEFGVVIDNSMQTPVETVIEIENFLAKEK
jgi:adenylate kinase family enzyme